MAHFAQLDENNTVTNVVVVSNDDINNLPFPESELVGIAFLNSLFPGKSWVQTSYNSNFRVRYAGVGYIYVATTAADPSGGFAPPKPFPSWNWDDNICCWVAPIPYPDNGKHYFWDDVGQKWATHMASSNPVTTIG